MHEGPAAAAGSSAGLAAVKLDGHKYTPVAVAASNTIKVRLQADRAALAA